MHVSTVCNFRLTAFNCERRKCHRINKNVVSSRSSWRRMPFVSCWATAFSASSSSKSIKTSIIMTQLSFKIWMASKRADHLVIDKDLNVIFFGVVFCKQSHRLVDGVKKLYKFWIVAKNELASEQFSTAHTPIKYSEWAAQGT